MPVYRAEGSDRFKRDASRTVYVEAAERAEAAREAMRLGVAGAELQEVGPAEVPRGERLHRARAALPAGDSALLREPIKTIAIGVFWGLVLFTILAALINLVVLALGALWGLF